MQSSAGSTSSFLGSTHKLSKTELKDYAREALRRKCISSIVEVLNCDVPRAWQVVASFINDEIPKWQTNSIAILIWGKVKECCFNKQVERKIWRLHINKWREIQSRSMIGWSGAKRSSRGMNLWGNELEQLRAGERLAAVIQNPGTKEFIAVPVPWVADGAPHYVSKPENKDVLEELLKVNAEGIPSRLDILHGLAFGYPIQDVLWFVKDNPLGSESLKE